MLPNIFLYLFLDAVRLDIEDKSIAKYKGMRSQDICIRFVGGCWHLSHVGDVPFKMWWNVWTSQQWNEIPASIRSAETITMFKEQLKTWLNRALKGVIRCFFKDHYFVYFVLCNRICWHALMLKKHIIFQILYIIVGPLCPASLRRVVFYKVPPFDKRSLLWLANWHSALWLAEHHKHSSKYNATYHNRELQLSK